MHKSFLKKLLRESCLQGRQGHEPESAKGKWDCGVGDTGRTLRVTFSSRVPKKAGAEGCLSLHPQQTVWGCLLDPAGARKSGWGRGGSLALGVSRAPDPVCLRSLGQACGTRVPGNRCWEPSWHLWFLSQSQRMSWPFPEYHPDHLRAHLAAHWGWAPGFRIIPVGTSQIAKSHAATGCSQAGSGLEVSCV